MGIAPWADAELSKQIPEIRAIGEGQHVEFKADFPQHATSLASEVAAFATSGGGKILIGVDDDGNVVGLNAEERDKTFHRAQGIVAQVQPKVACKISLCEDGGFVLAIEISGQQSEPVYYYDQRPYVRDGRTSRPATPDEVKQLVWSHPSSEHRRKMEELEHDKARRVADYKHNLITQHQQHMSEIDELSRRSVEMLLRNKGVTARPQ